ncbi:MAG: hypothetical protein KA244_07495 [Deltaproteobacteria bacterium]|nr:hypothetical protein [Deltaproteobacteria bacterium]
MKRRLYLFPSLFFFALVGCGGTSSNNNTSDGGTSDADMAQSNITDEKLCKGAGCIGASCIKDSECTEGTGGAAICWSGTLLNNAKLVATPGGYCSRECFSDADCGTAKCVSLPGTLKQYCMARCSSASTCRKPGYSCAYDGPTGGICFPSANFDCDPTTNDGICEFGVDRVLGGCVRAAYENDKGGICHQQCKVGSKTCPADVRFGTTNAPPQQCIYLDTTVDAKGNPAATGDKFRGNVCFQSPAAAVAPGAACQYWTDCGDGYQCDRYASRSTDVVCRQLCAQGNGTQADQPGLLVPMGAVPATGACMAAGSGCANSLRSGVKDGSPGLCQPIQ